MDRKIGAMTLRELTGAAVLVGLLLAGLLASWYLSQRQEALGEALESSGWLALSGQWENARQTAAQARQDWMQQWKLWAALADHGPMEEIDSLFQELTVCAAAGERTQFARLCAALAQKVEDLGDGQRLTWWNIL